MKNKKLYALLCVMLSVVVFVSASLMVSADTMSIAQDSGATTTKGTPGSTSSATTSGSATTSASATSTPATSTPVTTPPTTTAPTPTSTYTVKLLNFTKQEYTMTEKNGEYICYINFPVENPDLFQFTVNKDGKPIGNVEFLLYKASDGVCTFTYNPATGVNVVGGADDVFDTFDSKSQTYLITVDGGKLGDLPGKFKGRNISSFYYASGDNVVVQAIVDDGKQFKSWTCSDKLIKLDAEEVAEFTLPKKSSTKIDIKATFEEKEQSFGEMLLDYQYVTLEKDYVIKETIKLNTGEYEIDLSSFDLTSGTIAFEINGASLTITGDGAIRSTDSCAILLKSGSLIIDNGEFSGKICSIDARGGQLNITDGVFGGGTQSAISITSPCEVMINGGTYNLTGSKAALSVTGGKVAINGGSFYGSKAIEDWNAKRDISVYSGSFVSDVKTYIANGCSSERVGNMYNVKIEDPKYTLTVYGGTGGGLFKAGEKVTVVANGEDEVSKFEEWSILSGTVKLTDKTQKSMTFEMPEGDLVLKATFSIIAESETTPNSTTAPVTTAPSEETTTAPETVDTTLETVDTPETTVKADDSSSGSLALIILVIILCALLVAAIAVSIIIIVRKYKMEKEAQERSQLGDDIVADLADQLSGLDFGDVAAAGTAANDDGVDADAVEADADDANAESYEGTDVTTEDRPRPRRRLRTVPSASFEPEDLTVTKERDINSEE